MVEEAPSSPIGVAAGRRAVRSMRSANEKLPWKQLPGLQGSVEQEFVRPVHLGATLLPFRLLEPGLGIVSWDGITLLESADPHLDAYPGLADWWKHAEAAWDENKGESHLTLMEQIDFRSKLSNQFPDATAPHPVRQGRPVPGRRENRGRGGAHRSQALLGDRDFGRRGSVSDRRTEQSRAHEAARADAIAR